MGFGISTLGYLMTVFDSVAGGIIGWPLLVFGFYRLSSVNRLFRISSLLSVLCSCYAVYDIMIMLGHADKNGKLYVCLHIAYLVLKAFIHLFYMLAIKQIATEGGAKKIAVSSSMWLIFTELFYCASIAISFMPNSVKADLFGALVITNYFVGAANLWLLYTCYARITTEKQLKKDKEAHRKIDEQNKARKQKQKDEE